MWYFTLWLGVLLTFAYSFYMALICIQAMYFENTIWVGYIHLSDWSSWAQTMIFFSSPQNLFGLHDYVCQCSTKAKSDMCVLALQVFFKINLRNENQLFSCSACIQGHASSNSPPSSKWLALIINNEWKTLNSRRPDFFQLTGQKETPTSLWWPHSKIWAAATKSGPLPTVLVCSGMRSFLGHGIFSAKSRILLGKLGSLVTPHWGI